SLQTIQVDCGYSGGPQYFQAPTFNFIPTITVTGAGGGDSMCGGPANGPGNSCTYGGRGGRAAGQASRSRLRAARHIPGQGRGRGGDAQESYYTHPDGGYNGGGAGGSGSPWGGGAGGGATDVRSGAFGLDDRMIIAGGGGGSGDAWMGPDATGYNGYGGNAGQV